MLEKMKMDSTSILKTVSGIDKCKITFPLTSSSINFTLPDIVPVDNNVTTPQVLKVNSSGQMSYTNGGGGSSFGLLVEPVFGTVTQTSTYLEFDFTPINQELLGRSGIVDPHVDKLILEVEKVGTAVKNTIQLDWNYASHKNLNKIRILVDGPEGGSPLQEVSGNTFQFYLSNQLKSGDNIRVTGYYENDKYNRTGGPYDTKKTVCPSTGSMTLLVAGVPDKPTNVIITPNIAAKNVTIGWTPPVDTDIDILDESISNPPIEEYKIHYEVTSGGSSRYPVGQVTDTRTDLETNANVTSKSGIVFYADHTYRARVYAKNTQNIDWSNPSDWSSSVQIQAPSQITDNYSSSTGMSSTTKNFYIPSGSVLKSNTIIFNKSSTSFQNFSTLNNNNLNDTIGKNDSITFKTQLSGGHTASVEEKISPFTNDRTGQTTNAALAQIIGNPEDQQTIVQYQNFWKNADITAQVKPSELTASATPINLSVIKNSTIKGTAEFYVDDYSGSSYVDDVTITSTSSTQHLCGVTVLTGGTIGYTASLKNMGKYFVKSGNDILTAKLKTTSGGNLSTLQASGTSFANATSVEIDGTGIDFTLSGTTGNISPTFTPGGTELYFETDTIWNTSYIDSTTISGQNFYIDNSTDSANRVNLGTGQFPSGTVVDYDHTKSILAGTYADELQFVNGAYRTPADSSAYLNYSDSKAQDPVYKPNYSGITGTAYRYATFRFTPGTMTEEINMTISGMSLNGSRQPNSQSRISDMEISVKLVHATKTTSWLNANKSMNYETRDFNGINGDLGLIKKNEPFDNSTLVNTLVFNPLLVGSGFTILVRIGIGPQNDRFSGVNITTV